MVYVGLEDCRWVWCCLLFGDAGRGCVEDVPFGDVEGWGEHVGRLGNHGVLCVVYSRVCIGMTVREE